VSAPQFTPGPWSANCSHIYAPDGAIIAVVHNPGSKASDYPLVANRDLMAAAPELFAQLDLIVSEYLDGGVLTSSIVEAQDLLAKARGAQ
jgi:hypothetical protein